MNKQRGWEPEAEVSPAPENWGVSRVVAGGAGGQKESQARRHWGATEGGALGECSLG